MSLITAFPSCTFNPCPRAKMSAGPSVGLAGRERDGVVPAPQHPKEERSRGPARRPPLPLSVDRFAR